MGRVLQTCAQTPETGGDTHGTTAQCKVQGELPGTHHPARLDQGSADRPQDLPALLADAVTSPEQMCTCCLCWWPSPVHKSIGCSHGSSSAAGEQRPCHRQELGSGDGGCRVPLAVKASVMFTKVFWEDFAWERWMVGSDTQATWARGTCRASCQVPLDIGVSAQTLPCCKAGENQSSTAECL